MQESRPPNDERECRCTRPSEPKVARKGEQTSVICLGKQHRCAEGTAQRLLCGGSKVAEVAGWRVKCASI